MALSVCTLYVCLCFSTIRKFCTLRLTDWIPESRQDELNCCDSLLVSTTNPRSRAFEAQDEKFGVYRLQYVDRSPAGRGRATFKHIERDLFLYYVRDNGVLGWIIGPQPGVSIGGLFARVSNKHVATSH